ncbi:MAG: alpha/beta hydrolase, partial [Bacteroidota bacterium]
MRSRFVFILSCLAMVANAQPDFRFTHGLVIPQCHRYGREALVTDHVAFQLATGQFKTPVEHAKLFTNEQGNDVVWETLQADSTGKFKGAPLANGYIYLTYQSQRAQNALLNIS